MNLRGKVAVISGAGRLAGVGASVAKQLAERGCHLVLNCVSQQNEMQQLAEQCRQQGVDVVLFVADLTEETACQELAEITQEKFNRTDIIVNSLGYSKNVPLERLDLVDTELFNKCFRVNALAPFLIARAFQPLLRASDNSVIVNVSSAAALTGKSSSMPYSVAKGALNTLTLALAQALSPEVRVNAVCPSFIDSSWWYDKMPDKEKFEALKKNIRENNLLGRVLTPEDVAQAILSLIDNPAITGEIIRLDAGAHIGKGNNR